jgi:hypothetical protein
MFVRLKRTDMNLNGILECKLPSENEHRTSHVAVQRLVAQGGWLLERREEQRTGHLAATHLLPGPAARGLQFIQRRVAEFRVSEHQRHRAPIPPLPQHQATYLPPLAAPRCSRTSLMQWQYPPGSVRTAVLRSQGRHRVQAAAPVHRVHPARMHAFSVATQFYMLVNQYE